MDFYMLFMEHWRLIAMFTAILSLYFIVLMLIKDSYSLSAWTSPMSILVYLGGSVILATLFDSYILSL